jgi:uncharacterized protein (DUF1015 family)
MPEIKPFSGLRYNPKKVKSLARVLAPPYDVISKKGQETLYSASPYNVIRLILGKEDKNDNAVSNKYTRAGEFLRSWKRRGVLARDSKPSIYVYVQDYKENGKLSSRIGFLAAMRLDEKSVCKHENTLAAPKKDRMSLLKEVRTNLSPIFGLFEDEKGSVQEVLKSSLRLRPFIDVKLDGVRHRLFIEQRRDLIEKIERLMNSRPMFIADGHHRFEVACEYKKWKAESGKRKAGAPWDYVMTYFSDCCHNPFTIYPTHRLLLRNVKATGCPPRCSDPPSVGGGPRRRSKDIPLLLHSLKKYGRLRKVENLKSLLLILNKNKKPSISDYVFGVYTKKEGFFIFELDKKYFPDPKENVVERLEVSVLHKKIIEPCFGIKAVEKSPDIDFTRDAKEAFERVKGGEFHIAFFLKPTSLSQMLEVSKKGLKMPQKSTYFYPKLLSGLVFHSLVS